MGNAMPRSRSPDLGNRQCPFWKVSPLRRNARIADSKQYVNKTERLAVSDDRNRPRERLSTAQSVGRPTEHMQTVVLGSSVVPTHVSCTPHR